MSSSASLLPQYSATLPDQPAASNLSSGSTSTSSQLCRWLHATTGIAKLSGWGRKHAWFIAIFMRDTAGFVLSLAAYKNCTAKLREFLRDNEEMEERIGNRAVGTGRTRKVYINRWSATLNLSDIALSPGMCMYVNDQMRKATRRREGAVEDKGAIQSKLVGRALMLNSLLTCATHQCRTCRQESTACTRFSIRSYCRSPYHHHFAESTATSPRKLPLICINVGRGFKQVTYSQ